MPLNTASAAVHITPSASSLAALLFKRPMFSRLTAIIPLAVIKTFLKHYKQKASKLTKAQENEITDDILFDECVIIDDLAGSG